MSARPNILFIMTDQHRYDCLGCMGHPLVKTPNIDRIASSGIVFRNAYVPSPVCGPSRGALFSGQYPPGCGATTNPARFKEHAVLFPERLRDAGFQTGCVGKLHFAPEEHTWGFEHKWLHDAAYDVHSPSTPHSAYIRWLRTTEVASQVEELIDRFNADEAAFDTDIEQFILGGNFVPEPLHMTTWTADQSIAFLRQRDRSRPFMLYTSFFGPHQQWDPPAPWNRMYDPADVELRQLNTPTEDKPVFQDRFPESYRDEKFGDLTPDDYRRLIAAYYGSVSMIDHHIGRVLDVLRAEGLWEDTLIIFAADHGDHNGQFGLFFKSSMYESAARTPLLIKPAGEGPSGVAYAGNVSTLDLYGTLGDVAGVPDWRGEGVECDSLYPIVEGALDIPERPVFSILGAQTMLRRGPLKLMRVQPETGEAVYELYDLERDPLETVNCFRDPAYRDHVHALRRELDAWTVAHPWH